MALTKATYSMISGAEVNVFDFMTPAQIADVQAGTASIDVISAINAAMTEAAATQRELYFPAGTYLISSTITIPVTATYARFAIRGEFSNDISNSSNMPGTVIKTSGNFTALQTPVLTAPNNTIAFWTKDLEIRDIYVSGPQNLASAPSSSVGFNLSGVQFLKAHNLHAEGFGTGLYIENGSEIYLSGRHLYQNNYYGAFLKRSDTATTDLQAWAENLVCVNNYIPLVLRTVRSFWCNNGEFITYGNSAPLTGRTPMSRIYIEASYNTQIHFSNCSIENDEDITIVSIDSTGLGVLTFDKCNFESAKFPLITCEGFFDTISVTNCLFGPTPGLVSTNQEPIIYLNNSDTSDSDLRSNEVNMSGNSPSWASFAIYDNSVNRSPYGDRVPAYMQQLNTRREMDQASDNHITVYGNYGYSTSNVLVGNARLYWSDAVVANNYAIITPSRPIKGASTLWVTIIADTNFNNTVPYVYQVSGIGTSPADWQLVYSCQLGQFTVGAKTFYKWGYAIEILNATTSYSPGVQTIGLANIYSTAGGSDSGLEYFAVYSDQRDVGYVQSTDRVMAAAPSSATDGYGAVGDKVYNSTPSAGNLGWVCTVAGIPGTWVNFG